MNVFYKVTQVGTRKTTYYEIEIPFDSFLITIFLINTHFPTKRLTRYNPLQYFMIFPEDMLGIIVISNVRGELNPNYKIELDKPNPNLLKALIEKIKCKIGSEELGARNIIDEFLKTL